VKTVSDKVVRHSLAYLSMRKWLVGVTFLGENLADTDLSLCTMPIFISIFAYGTSAITPSKKLS